MLIYSFPATRALAQRVARLTHTKLGKLHVSPFPDGETYLRFNTSPKNQDVVIFHTTHEHQNTNILDALFAVATAKDLGAKTVILILPYLAYLRQDKRFNDGECVSAPIIGKLLSSADALITVQPHLHRIHQLTDIFTNRAISINAGAVLGEHIQRKLKITKPLLLGPDEESVPLVEAAAARCGGDIQILTKTRLGSRAVRQTFPAKELFHQRNVVLVDDMISTGTTILNAIKHIKRAQPKSVSVLCVHGLFHDDAAVRIKKTGVKHLAATTTIPNSSATIDIAPLLAKELQKLFAR